MVKRHHPHDREAVAATACKACRRASRIASLLDKAYLLQLERIASELASLTDTLAAVWLSLKTAAQEGRETP